MMWREDPNVFPGMAMSISPDELELQIECAPCGALLVHQDGSIKLANRVFVTYCGSSKEELEHTSLSEYVDMGADVGEWAAELIRYAVRHRACPEITVKTAGISRRTRASVAAYHHVGGEQVFAITLHDFDHHTGVALLRRFADRFIKDVNLGVLLIDTDFSLIDISDMACRVLGVDKERVLFKPMDEVFSFVPAEHRLVQRTLLNGLVVRNHAVSWMNNQERYELLMDSHLLKDSSERTVGAYIIFKDVTNLRSLEEQVQRSDRLAMIGQIAAGTAHEIRNPLTSIKGFLQVFKKTLLERGMEKECSYADIMLTEINRINELVSEFLLLSKPKDVVMHSVDVATVIREILPIINNEAILHGVFVEYESCLRLPKVVADRELLKQVFLNICKNGIEAIVDGGTLRIAEKTDIEDKKVLIEIQDSGPGIPAFVIDKIFDPFYTTKENGTGLGLSVCQRIIHDLGGHIRVSSKGFGTTFTICIPYSESP